MVRLRSAAGSPVGSLGPRAGGVTSRSAAERVAPGGTVSAPVLGASCGRDGGVGMVGSPGCGRTRESDATAVPGGRGGAGTNLLHFFPCVTPGAAVESR